VPVKHLIEILEAGRFSPFVDVHSGTSFVMVLEFTDRGPRTLALLVSGQTATQPRAVSEQTEMFAARLWWTFPTSRSRRAAPLVPQATHPQEPRRPG